MYQKKNIIAHKIDNRKLAMERSQDRGIISRKRLFFIISLIVGILLLLSFHDISSEFEYRIVYSRMKQDPNSLAMELQLSTLIKDEDKFQLKRTGLSCNSELEIEICIIIKQVRINTQSLNIYLSPSHETTQEIKEIKIIKPYAIENISRAMNKVQQIQIIQGKNSKNMPNCEHSHMVPMIIFSTGGFSENAFHDFNDIIIPLYLTSRHFRSQVRFLITDYRLTWVIKYGHILKQLSSYEFIKADKSNGSIHCFPGGVIGLKYHGFLGINSSMIPKGYKFDDFRQFLFETYDLKVNKLMVKSSRRPVVVLISRKGSRMLLNEDEIVNMMVGLGFQVRIPTPDDMNNLEKLSSLVNQCRVMVGVHGAGLVNEVFLPKGAVVVQFIPVGLMWQSISYYAEPTPKMGLKYLEYRVGFDESSLYESYSRNDLVIINPPSVYAKGFSVAKAIYLEEQNLRINVTKFKATMSHALELLEH
ncbi:xylan glycosyltransferase MUCI21-like [Silene latifolia]|uniref:xylan glycosyltransferase MUCI21-like n=1 Tax=Silene latifolia TaxID=37657 RepID=UPI003D785481